MRKPRVGSVSSASGGCVGRGPRVAGRRMEQRQRGVVGDPREPRRRLAKDRADPVRVPQGVGVERRRRGVVFSSVAGLVPSSSRPSVVVAVSSPSRVLVGFVPFAFASSRYPPRVRPRALHERRGERLEEHEEPTARGARERSVGRALKQVRVFLAERLPSASGGEAVVPERGEHADVLLVPDHRPGVETAPSGVQHRVAQHLRVRKGRGTRR